MNTVPESHVWERKLLRDFCGSEKILKILLHFDQNQKALSPCHYRSRSSSFKMSVTQITCNLFLESWGLWSYEKQFFEETVEEAFLRSWGGSVLVTFFNIDEVSRSWKIQEKKCFFMSLGACRDDRWCDAGLRILKLCKNNVNRREGAPICPTENRTWWKPKLCAMTDFLGIVLG